MKAKSNNSFKQDGFRTRIGRFAILLGSLFLLYMSYCWGTWGRNSLLIQYLFQCGCPHAIEEFRYPDQVDVIVPACRYETARLLPSGRLLYVDEKRLGFRSNYLLDLQTNEKIKIGVPKGDFYFLTDNLLYVSSGDEYILDWRSGKQYPIQKFAYWHSDAYKNDTTNLPLLRKALSDAKNVYLIDDNDTVVALSSEFPASTEDSFVTGWFDIPGFDPNRVEQFLRENNIVYQSTLANSPSEVTSPDGRFIARHDGIYLITTNQLIVKAYPSRVRGWTSDGRGVIYSSSGSCLIQTNFGFLDDTTCLFEVPQPILKLRMPEEYLSPNGIQ